MKTLTEQLKDAIREHGGSITALAKEVGIPQPVLHRFVNDERDMYLKTVEKLAQFFGLTFAKVGDSKTAAPRSPKTRKAKKPA